MELLEGGGIMSTVKDVEIRLDEENLGIILGVPTKGIRMIEGVSCPAGSLKMPLNVETSRRHFLLCVCDALVAFCEE
ncbi:hypothetical protein H5410_005980 [Solanum commersonii]|uniref:Uncharacterized protein n=1 Tax=Solanum commersonii TaxID=4109 RepID=A0A9J6A906_SOLCO|nr:hypothetical protein H5410_005980 [Solanum commersonii]